MIELLWLGALIGAAVADTGLEDTDTPCVAAHVRGVSPDPGAEAVPIDVQPAVALSGDRCGFDDVYVAELRRASDGRLIERVEQTWDGDLPPRLLRVSPERDLDPGEVYRVSVSAEGELLGDFEFITSDALSLGASAGPEIDGLRFLSWAVSDGVRTEARVDAAVLDDGDDLAMLVLETEDGEVLAAERAPTGRDITLYGDLGVLPADLDELCFVVRQEDATGRALSSERVCGDPWAQEEGPAPDAAACGTTRDGRTGAPLVVAALIALGLFRRRR